MLSGRDNACTHALRACTHALRACCFVGSDPDYVEEIVTDVGDAMPLADPRIILESFEPGGNKRSR